LIGLNGFHGDKSELFSSKRASTRVTVRRLIPSSAAIDRNRQEIELELVWSLHAAIFYISMRKWVYRTKIPNDINAVIDALAPGIDLSPLFALMTNQDVLKVFHAARQDIEIVWNLARAIPHPIFDSQVAAMVLGYGDSISYDQLVARITGDNLDKSHRFTDWTRRPLSPAQLAYAVSDVTHLRDVYLKLASDLDKQGRAEWMREEIDRDAIRNWLIRSGHVLNSQGTAVDEDKVGAARDASLDEDPYLGVGKEEYESLGLGMGAYQLFGSYETVANQLIDLYEAGVEQFALCFFEPRKGVQQMRDHVLPILRARGYNEDAISL